MCEFLATASLVRVAGLRRARRAAFLHRCKLEKEAKAKLADVERLDEQADAANRQETAAADEIRRMIKEAPHAAGLAALLEEAIDLAGEEADMRNPPWSVVQEALALAELLAASPDPTG
jgi:hypothetical protein